MPIALSTVVLSADLGAQQKYALLIANQGYSGQRRLTTPVVDGDALRQALVQQGYGVTFLQDVRTKGKFELAVREFVRAIPANSIALVWYSGHGFELDGRSFLLPIDARVRSEAEASVEGVDLSTLLDLLASRRGIKPVVVLDACRDLKLAPSTERWNSVPKPLSPLLRSARAAVLFSTGEGSSAADATKTGPSIFGEALVGAFREGRRTLSEIADHVISQVGASLPDQRPVLVSTLASGIELGGRVSQASTSKNGEGGNAGVPTRQASDEISDLLQNANTVKKATPARAASGGEKFLYTSGRYRYSVVESLSADLVQTAGTFGLEPPTKISQKVTRTSWIDVDVFDKSPGQLRVRVRIDSMRLSGSVADPSLATRVKGSIVETDMAPDGRLGASTFLTTGGRDVQEALWGLRSPFPVVSFPLAIDNEWTDTSTYSSPLGAAQSATTQYHVITSDVRDNVRVYSIRSNAIETSSSRSTDQSMTTQTEANGEFVVSDRGQLLKSAKTSAGTLAGRTYLGQQRKGTVSGKSEIRLLERLR